MPPEQKIPVKNINHFDTEDYMVFFSMLVLSALTGLYFGCRGKYCSSRKGQTLSEYLTGNKSFAPIPVALSLMGSHISGIMVVGMPSEFYHYGLQYCLMIIPATMGGLTIAFVFLPVLFRLQVSSSYEYLELRFNKSIRTITSVTYVLAKVLFLPVVIYAPSLAFNQVTGINIYLIGSIVCFVCVFYTLPGGFKAVIWTDLWQVIVIFVSMLVVLISGTIYLGRTHAIIEVINEGGKFATFNFSPSMYDRYTVLNMVLGATVHWCSNNAVSQHTVQKYMSCPTEKQSKLSVVLFSIGEGLYVGLSCYAGLLIYTTYHNCDPRSMGRIKADDQIFPLYVMESIGHLKLIPGLFMAAIFCAAMRNDHVSVLFNLRYIFSTLSVMLNAVSQVVYEDFIKSCMRMSLPETTAMTVAKSVILVLGILSVALLFVVEHLGAIVQLTVSINAITGGTICGIFTLGMLIPWANTYGAIFGGMAGLVMSSLLSFGSNFAKATKLVSPQKLPVFVNDSCFDKYQIDRNISIPVQSYPHESSVFPLFRLSFWWITLLSISTVLIVGTIVSFITGKTNLKILDPDLISPVAQWILPEEAKRHIGSSRQKARRVEEREKMLLEMKSLEDACKDLAQIEVRPLQFVEC